MRKKGPISTTWITTKEALKAMGLQPGGYKTLMKRFYESGMIERTKKSTRDIRWGLESIQMYNNSGVLGGDNLRQSA